MQPGFPSPRNDDAEDVAWGLTTGAALWKQGEHYDAIVWLKRAVASAAEVGAVVRADELNRAATDLLASLAALAPSLGDSQPPPPLPGFLDSPPPMPALWLDSPPSPDVFLDSPASADGPPPSPHAGLPPAKLPPPIANRVATIQPSRPSWPTRPSPTVAPPLAAPPPALSPARPSSGMGSLRREIRPIPPLPGTPSIPRRTEPPVRTLLVTEVDEEEINEEETLPLPLLTPFGSPATMAAAPSLSPIPTSQPSVPSSRPPSVAPPISLEALGALTQEQRDALLRTATIESLDAEEEVTVAGLALVITGQAAIQATVADTSAGMLGAGELLYAKSPIAETLSLRLVAEVDQTQVALWDLKAADDSLSSSPTLLGELKLASARIQAVAGCTMGAIGERLDEALRALAIERLETRILQPHEVLAAAGLPVPGLIIVGVGTVELDQDNGAHDRLVPGDFLFATEVLGAEPAPCTARAGAKGAIVLFGARALAHELLVTCPPLLEIFAGM